jgi:hypothetical protein
MQIVLLAVGIGSVHPPASSAPGAAKVLIVFRLVSSSSGSSAHGFG